MRRYARLCLWVGLGLVALQGCSEPECPNNETKIGKSCVPSTKANLRDTGLSDRPSDAASIDGSTFDAGRGSAEAGVLGDGRVDVPPPSVVGQTLPDAAIVQCDVLSCEPGSTVSCKTSCGTNGSALCPATCTDDTAPSCAPPAESCNGQDDDCDGVVDQNLVARLPAGARVWTGPAVNDSGTLGLLPLRAGGAWVVYKAASGHPTFHRLDANGNASGNDVAPERLVDVTNIRFSTDGKWIALLNSYGTTVDADGNLTGTLAMKIVLYRAEDLSFVDEYVLTAPGDVLCGGLYVFGIDVQEDSTGNLHFALVRSVTRAPVTDGTCQIAQVTGTVDLLFVTYTKAKTWSSVTQGISFGGVGFFGGLPIAIAKAPCGEGWFAVYASGSDRALRFYSPAGKELTNYDPALSGVDTARDIAASRADCSSGRTALVVAHGAAASTRSSIPRVRRWSLVAGASSLQSADDFAVGGAALGSFLLTQSGGRVFVSGMDFAAQPRAYEVSATSNSSREIDLMPLTTVIPTYKPSDVENVIALLGGNSTRLVQLADLGHAYALSVLQLPVVTGLEAAREAGDINPPIGVTYRIGCP